MGEQTYRYPGLAWRLMCPALNVIYEAQTVGLDSKFSIWLLFPSGNKSNPRHSLFLCTILIN